jgi:hypothetical protein
MGKHAVGEIWKDGRDWKTQLPKGVMTSTTKKRALLFADSTRPGFSLGATQACVVCGAMSHANYCGNHGPALDMAYNGPS